MKINEGKKLIFEASQELLEAGLFMGSWGNLSCRVDMDASKYPEQGSFLVTSAGKTEYSKRSEEDVVEMGLEDYSYESELSPSVEYRIHALIYKNRPEINWVIHTHQTNASAAAAMSLDVIKFDRDYEGIGNFVLCSQYALIGSRRLMGNVTKTLAETDSNAIIMKNHGALCFGKTYEEAIAVARNLEEACGNYLTSIGIELCDMSDWNHDGFNMSPTMEKYLTVRDSLPAYLTAFAQFVGSALPVIEEWDREQMALAKANKSAILVKGKGLHCFGDDKDIMANVVEQNCMAALAAIGTKPLDALRCKLLNETFKRS